MKNIAENKERRSRMNVLVVVDMQKDFIDGSLGTKEAAAIVPAVLKVRRESIFRLCTA